MSDEPEIKHISEINDSISSHVSSKSDDGADVSTMKAKLSRGP